MLGLLIFLLIIAGLCAFTAYWMTKHDGELLTILLGVIVIIWSGIGWYPCLGFFGGLVENYGNGSRVGYLTKVSIKGIHYKTCEASLQVGTGEMAALQSPWEFSVPMTHCEELAEWSEKYSKKRISVQYTQWLFMPFKIGESSYYMISYKEIDQ